MAKLNPLQIFGILAGYPRAFRFYFERYGCVGMYIREERPPGLGSRHDDHEASQNNLRLRQYFMVVKLFCNCVGRHVGCIVNQFSHIMTLGKPTRHIAQHQIAVAQTHRLW